MTFPTLTEPARLTAIAGLAIVVAACNSTAVSSPSPAITTQPWARLASQTPDVSRPTCLDLFTPPPYDAFRPVPGISVRAIDQVHFEITNATSRTFYFGVFQWTTEDNLVCGRGVIGRDVSGGLVPSGATVDGLGGSAPEVPATVAIWARPCGEGCNDVPIGEFVVPISAVEPPQPGAT